VQDGKQAEFEAVAGELVSAVRANEPNTLTYTLTKKKGSNDEYVFVEHYKSAEDRSAHGRTEHFRAIAPRMGAFLAGPPQMLELDLVV
jgi:quinol monooxygenase YgiN